jgi:hypothetical protein
VRTVTCLVRQHLRASHLSGDFSFESGNTTVRPSALNNHDRTEHQNCQYTVRLAGTSRSSLHFQIPITSYCRAVFAHSQLHGADYVHIHLVNPALWYTASTSYSTTFFVRQQRVSCIDTDPYGHAQTKRILGNCEKLLTLKTKRSLPYLISPQTERHAICRGGI